MTSRLYRPLIINIYHKAIGDIEGISQRAIGYISHWEIGDFWYKSHWAIGDINNILNAFTGTVICGNLWAGWGGIWVSIVPSLGWRYFHISCFFFVKRIQKDWNMHQHMICLFFLVAKFHTFIRTLRPMTVRRQEWRRFLESNHAFSLHRNIWFVPRIRLFQKIENFLLYDFMPKQLNENNTWSLIIQLTEIYLFIFGLVLTS